MTTDIPAQVAAIVTAYDPAAPAATADQLRALWLQAEPKSMGGIKAEQREQQETVGTPVPVLHAIGKEISKVARQQVDDYIPLVRTLWDSYGREGRVVAAAVLGPMEVAAPDTIIPLLMALGRTCITWEDADQLAMRALEPVVRKQPDRWFSALDSWIADDNKWVRRIGVIVAGRLAMKDGAYAARALTMAERLLPDEETDVKRGVSFAIRLTARGDVAQVRDFLTRHVPPENPVATWVLCDAMRSMATKLLPEFAPLLPCYEQWAADPALSAQDRRSVVSAVKTLEKVTS